MTCEVALLFAPGAPRPAVQIPRYFDMATVIPERELGKGRLGVARVVRTDAGALLCQKAIGKGNLVSKPDDTFLPFVAKLFALRAPPILPLLEFGTDSENYYLFSPVAEHGSLRATALHGATEKTCAVVGIAAGLRRLHTAGIVHGDLKPENVLLDGDNRALLSDFGLASLEIEGVIETRALGNACYCPPEQFDGVYGAKGDVYSFGLILYEIAVGRPVFPASLPAMVIIKKSATSARPEIPPEVTDVTRGLIGDCWGPDPDARKSSDEIWAYLLVNYTGLFPDIDVGVAQAYIQSLQ
jgi:serine/threonine protein kinase